MEREYFGWQDHSRSVESSDMSEIQRIQGAAVQGDERSADDHHHLME